MFKTSSKARSASVPVPFLSQPFGRDPVLLGTTFGIVSALGYTGTNMALRAVADRPDLDWAAWVSCLKALPAAAVAWLLVGWHVAAGRPGLPPRRLVIPLVATGLAMQFGGNLAFQWSLSVAGLALTVPLCFATLILSGALLGRMYLAEGVTPRSAAAMGLLLAAIVLLSAGAEDAAQASGSTEAPVQWTRITLAVVAAAASGVAYGASGVVIRRMVTQRLSLAATLVLLSTAGFVALGAMCLIRMGPRALLATPPGDFGLMLLAGSLNAAAFFAVSAALKYLAVVHVNLLNASQTAMCAAAGVLMFGETLTGWLVAGIGLTIAGLMLLDRKRPAFDVQRIRKQGSVRRVECHAELPSTSDRALELAAREVLDTPCLVLAGIQTGGRGRGANRWWAGPGALTFSLIVEAAELRVPAERWPKLALTAGLAVSETIGELVPGAPIGLKWPNDVFLAGRKVSGILVEVPSSRSGRLVLGIGINVNNSLAGAPDGLRASATSLVDETGRRFDLTDVLVGVLARLDREFAGLAAADVDLSERWRASCMLEGQTLAVTTGEDRVAGVCAGVDRDGALLVDTSTGRRRIYSGTVTLLGTGDRHDPLFV
jgi:BirA family biotin operon repressor/biotin-[acetyl-CoA-carboxylase] ligase